MVLDERDLREAIADAFVRVVTHWVGHRGVDFRIKVTTAIQELLLSIEWPVGVDPSSLMMIIEPHENAELVDVTIRERTAIDDLAEATGE